MCKNNNNSPGVFLLQCVFMKLPQGGSQRPLGTLLGEQREKGKLAKVEQGSDPI